MPSLTAPAWAATLNATQVNTRAAKRTHMRREVFKTTRGMIGEAFGRQRSVMCVLLVILVQTRSTFSPVLITNEIRAPLL